MHEPTTPLSKNFTLGEFLRSDVAERDYELKKEQESPPEEIINNLKHLVETVLQPVRSNMSFPVRITSGYRCPMVNKLVGGSGTSQHCRGEAADCQISQRFLTDAKGAAIREDIETKVLEITGKPLRPDTHPNFYLFAYLCLYLEELDIDQVIHEYGSGFGQPAWIHISASDRQDKRDIVMVGSYTNGRYIRPSLEQAIAYGT